ncbi:hypothetical protein ABFA07_014669 [Porites harrisoni]
MAFQKILAFIGIILLGVATADDDRPNKRDINVYRSHVKITAYNSHGYKPTSFRPTSCVDYLRRGISESGSYKLYDQSGKSYAAYCDMKSELDTAWTMVMSWALKSKALSIYENPLQVQLPTKRRRPKLGSLPPKSGANEILAEPRPLTGELHAATRSMASILETTFGETSRTLTSLICWWTAHVRKWNTSTSGDTWARI